ncbi:MAG: tRNA preQ1(34) S-adenosylmethionine ribosyltransferase-isomerase QueA [Candidatus Dadabacteria bacterium]|nr:tRNA preQ1(34) S-adenosylmethionine ribosyltransferase-isomerase QueA [Candidatus Dadabacteria bacterium]NIQ16216.1 tRNA preQ1(34) S-adenosylmethionine ribosyltransferase-isomerase QueA [Candidatus Dadabacteria bacterium]
MRTSDFDYDLPDHLIAYYPVKDRTQSRLIIVDRNKRSFTHKYFYDLIEYLNPGDLLLLNNTKVIPARLIGSSKNRKNIEILLVNRIDDLNWEILLKKPKDKLIVDFEGGVSGEVKKSEENIWIIKFNKPIDSIIWDIGHMPLPPYIERNAEDEDKLTYQTVFAEIEGAIAAPTAGLHISEDFLEKISEKGVEIQYITLHVGIGTFRPVKGEFIEEHKMHSEYMNINDEVCKSINKAKTEGRRVVAVGTTVVRAVESANSINNMIKPTSGSTNLFIKPPYKFKFIDALITNFHMPRSTLLMLVSAFADKDLILSAYREAINKNYRFLSYGDAMFIV